MSITEESIKPVVIALEEMMKTDAPEHAYVILFLDPRDDQCDFISSIHPDLAVSFIAKWLTEMLLSKIMRRGNDDTVGNA